MRTTSLVRQSRNNDSKSLSLRCWSSPQSDLCLEKNQAVIKRSGIQNIKVHYMTGRPLSSIFRPPKEQKKCPETCETCISAKKVNKCLSKNCLYIIECTHCHLVYIGEASRTLGSRIKENLPMEKQTTYQHLVKHTNTPMLKDISWDILHNNIRHVRSSKRSKSVRKTLKPS